MANSREGGHSNSGKAFDYAIASALAMQRLAALCLLIKR
jgi:hypothetical protein